VLCLKEHNDVHLLSHADPSVWLASYKITLTNLVASGGRLYHPCRFIRELDVNLTHFLSTDSLQSAFQRHAGVQRQAHDVPAVLSTPHLGT
jgi:hypothetical protein